jgi:hypothetical protein
MIDLATMTTTKNTLSAPAIMLYGLEGIGKTTFGADFPSPYFICAEDGMRNKIFDGIPRYFPGSFQDILDVLDALATQPHVYKTVVIDTLDAVQKLIFEHIARKNNKENIEDIGYGKGYKFAALEIPQLLARFERLQKKDIAVLLLCHAGIKNFANPEGENYDRYVPMLFDSIAAQIKQYVDFILFSTYKVGVDGKKGIGGKERIIYTEHCAAYDAKSRCEMPEQIPLDAQTFLSLIGDGAENGMKKMTDRIQNLLPSLDDATKASVKKWLDTKKYTIAAVSRTLKKCEEMAAKTNKEANNA